MKKLSLLLLILLSINGLKVSSQSLFFQQNILSSSDDAEEKFDGSSVTTSSSDIELMYDTWNSQGLQTAGLRFDNIVVPSNATIVDAYIQFTADKTNSGSMTITFKGEDVANSTTFANTTNNISGRATTSSSVVWSPPAWTNNQSGTNEKSPDLSTIVSEVISSNGWQSGNPITFIITGTGNATDYRKADSYDENAAQSAKLVIEYTSNYNIDLAITSCILPNASAYPDPTATVKVDIRNNGISTATSYNVSYSVNGVLIATEPGTVALTTGQSVAFTFAQTANLAAVGTYNLSAEVTIANDENTLNDTIIKPITIINDIDTLFFSQGNYWRYWDSSTNPGSTWKDVSFNDSLWPVGISQFGFGEGDEQTVLNAGLLRYCFRKKVNVTNVSQLSDVYIHMVHDDGALIYVNGQEVVRSEGMPIGAITYNTPARQSNNKTNENNFYTYKVNSSYFVNGVNTIAVSVHNRSTSNDDVSFDCYITSGFQYDQDGPYVSYDGGNIIVEEVTPTGVVSNTYTSAAGIQLTCILPHMNTSFSFNLKPQITIEPSIYNATPPKFLAISDFDGHIEGFTMILRREGIIDSNFNWTYGNGHLIVSGDLFDRGFHITESMWLLYKLESEAEAAGGKVHLILGNHEMMNLTDDWRYAEIKYFNNSHLMGKRMSELYDADTELGRWLRSKNIIEKLGDYGILHGGISPQVAALNLTYDQMNDYGRMKINGTCSNSACLTVNGSNGLYWYREMVKQTLTQAQVDEILDSLDVKRVIVGHTKDNTIRSLYNGRVLAIDMYHINNFNNGFMEALQFELGCFYLFHTDNVNETYTQLGDCDSYADNILEINGDNQLQIYPNPTTDYLTVKLPEKLLGDYDYFVIDQSGRQVCKGKINSDITNIDVSRYPTGTYFLTIQNSKQTITGHFILKR